MKGQDMMNETTTIYWIEKLPGKNEGWAIFDSVSTGSIAGTRSKFRYEAYEAAAEMGITISAKPTEAENRALWGDR